MITEKELENFRLYAIDLLKDCNAINNSIKESGVARAVITTKDDKYICTISIKKVKSNGTVVLFDELKGLR